MERLKRFIQIPSTLLGTEYLQFLEEIIECATSIRGLGRRGLTISTAGVSRLSFNRCTGHEEFTCIPQIFLCYPFSDRLRALKLCRCIKVAAVLARVEVGFTLGTLAFVLDVDGRRNDCAAQSAAQHFLKTRHLDWPRRFPGFRPAWSTLRLFTRFFAFAFATIAVVILVTALAVFSFHRRGFEKIPGACSNAFTVDLLIRLQQVGYGSTGIRIPRKRFHIFSESFRKCGIRIGRGAKPFGIDRIAEVKLDRVQPETAGTGPGLK